MLGDKEINKEDCDMLSEYPCVLGCVDDVLLLLKRIDGSSLCVGNSDDRFSELVDAHKGKLLDKYGKIIILNLNVLLIIYVLCAGKDIAVYDSIAIPHATIRRIKCAHIIKKGSRCQKCTLYTKNLNSLCSQYRSCQSETSNRTAASSHINFKYLSTPEKIICLQNLHKENQSTHKKLRNLERRVANV